MTTITDHDVERYVEVDLYEVLHVTAQASAELIDRAYRMRLNQVHPDHAGAVSTDLARLVNAAGAILRQPEARARYDALRNARQAKHESRERDAHQRRVSALENELAQAQQELASSQQELVTTHEELARLDVERAAGEADRHRLEERLQWITSQTPISHPRWSWPSWMVGGLVGTAALSVVLGATGASPVRIAAMTPLLLLPAPLADIVASRGADAEWSDTLHDLDATWEQDWPATIGRLDAFLARWPDYVVAKDKLYAALVADAEDHVQSGQVDAAVAELQRAARLLPERGEAWAELVERARDR